MSGWTTVKPRKRASSGAVHAEAGSMPKVYKDAENTLPVVGICGDYKTGYKVQIPKDVRVIFGPLAPKDYIKSAKFTLDIKSKIHYETIHLLWRNDDVDAFLLSELLADYYEDTPIEEQPFLIKIGAAGTFTMMRAGTSDALCYSTKHASDQPTSVTGFLEAINSELARI